MAFNHRKMLSDSENANCTLYCGPEKEGEFYCDWPCMQFCSPICPHPPLPTIPTIDQTDPPRHVHRFSLLFTVLLTAVAAAVFLLCVFIIYKYYTGRRSSRRGSQARTEEIHDDLLDEDHGPVLDHPIWYIRTVGLQPSVISSIAVCKYKRGDGLIEGTECAVCLSEFEEDETLRLLPKCNHAFHIPCIDTWLRSHTNCPLCRARIVINSVAVGLPLPESNTDNSGVGEETQVGISDNDGESGRETQNEGSEVRIGVEEGGALQVDSGRKSNGNSIEEGGSSDVQPMRRSVSLDNLSASIISLAVTNGLRAQSSGNSDNQLIKLNDSNMGNASKRVAANQSLLRLVGSSSIGRSLQRGPSSVKRSLSCSGKLFLSRYCRSGNSVRPH